MKAGVGAASVRRNGPVPLGGRIGAGGGRYFRGENWLFKTRILKIDGDYSFFSGIAPSTGAAGSFFFGPATVTLITPPRAVSAAGYCASIVRHFVGQTSTQQSQTTQRIWSICQVFSLTSTQMACVGHLRWQDLQVMQPSGLIVTCPRVMIVFFAGLAGYIRVAGRENRLLTIVLVISK